MKLEKLIEEAIKETFGELEDGTKEQMRFLAFIAGFLKKADEFFEGKNKKIFYSGALSMLTSLKSSGFLKDCYEDIDLKALFKPKEVTDVHERTN